MKKRCYSLGTFSVLHIMLLLCIVSVAGVFQAGQQWEVHTEGPAGRPDAESPQVPSPPAGLIACDYHDILSTLQSM